MRYQILQKAILILVFLLLFIISFPTIQSDETNQKDDKEKIDEIYRLVENSQNVNLIDQLIYESTRLTSDSSLAFALQAQQLSNQYKSIPDTTYATILNQLGYSYYCLEDYKNSKIYLDSALNIRKNKLEKSDIRIGETYNYLYMLSKEIDTRELQISYQDKTGYIVF